MWSPGLCVPHPPSSEWGTLSLGHLLTYSGLAIVAGVSLNFSLLREHYMHQMEQTWLSDTNGNEELKKGLNVKEFNMKHHIFNVNQNKKIK